MTEIRISPERLRDAASQLDNQRAEIDNVLTSMINAVNGLQGEWTGMANIDYTQIFNDEVPPMQTRVIEILERLTNEMRRIAQVFEETDQAVI
jgi:WXG100 family type VII secretion target